MRSANRLPASSVARPAGESGLTCFGSSSQRCWLSHVTGIVTNPSAHFWLVRHLATPVSTFGRAAPRRTTCVW